MTTSTDELAILVARARRELEAAGELHPPKTGSYRWDIPDSVRDAIAEVPAPSLGP